jgi:hypothetical protein
MKGWILAFAALAACSDSDTNVAGNYSVSLTNGDNGCNLSNFTPGQTATNVAITVTQNSSNVTLTVEGVAGLYLIGLLGGGNNVFTGDVSGDGLDVDAIGTKPNTSGNCTYTYNSHISGTLDGDVLRGRIEYRAADNGNSGCTAVHDCLTFQDYNGTRPPR